MAIDQTQIISLFLTPELFKDFTPVEQSQAVTVFREQKILARMCYRLEAAGVFDSLDAKTQRHLLNAKKIADRQKEQVFNEARELARVLSNTVGYLIFLKGAAYSMCSGNLGKGRIYSDIDVLVPKKDIKACEQRLAINGWLGQEISDYDDKYYRKWAHEIPPMAHGFRGTIIDVHHNIVPIISKASLDIDSLLEHKEEILPGIFVLSGPAQLVHAAIHLFRNEEYKGSFRDLTDLYLMLEGQDESFGLEAISIAEHIGFKHELSLAIRYVHTILSLDIPETVLASAKSSGANAFNDFVFSKVLLPQHKLLAGSATPFKHTLAMIRGHIVKMPLHILIYHLVLKSARGILESIFGAHIFTPKDDNPLTATHQKDANK
ncbi:nucleotidyltransferase family protein [Glaciecola sp. SC05]|uniref:nucleotidyltransferase family protein n=1 Tax=Glaciecola sp. SC05 TaxID=1987355 RepID=UPI003529C9D1